MLNTAMAEGSFTLHNLQSTSGELADTQDALTQAIDAQRSPANLAARADQARHGAGRLRRVPAPLGRQGPRRGEAGEEGGRLYRGDGSAGAVRRRPARPRTRGPKTTVTKKGDVTTTTVVVTKPDGSVVTTVTSVNARTKTTTSTTTTKPPAKKPATETADHPAPTPRQPRTTTLHQAHDPPTPADRTRGTQ